MGSPRALLVVTGSADEPTLISSGTDRTKTAAGHIAELIQAGLDGRASSASTSRALSSPLRAGTHPAERLAEPNLARLASLCDEVRSRWSPSPQLPGALDLVAECRRRGIVVSFGQGRDADASEARRGFESGGQAVTHIFTRCLRFLPVCPAWREQRWRSTRAMSMIADRVHVADDLLRLALGSRTGAGPRPVMPRPPQDAVTGQLLLGGAARCR